MRLSTQLMYAGNPRQAADQVTAMEKAGLDTVWVPEAYGFDSPTLMGYLAARTETIEIGSAILNVYSRTPALIAKTAAGLDNVSEGRAILGLGASGPQVIEGWHGMPYDRPLTRTREVVEIVRKAVRRETLVHDGKVFTLPLPADQGTGLGKPLKMLTKPERTSIPIYIAALGPKNVEGAAEYADGWLPFLFAPEKVADVWGGALAAGKAKRDPSMGDLQISAGGLCAIGEDVKSMLDLARPMLALYIGGMGAREKNFYNQLVSRVRLRGGGEEDPGSLPGWQQARCRGRGPAGAAGDGEPGRPESYVKERIAAFAEAGVTNLQIMPAAEDPLALISRHEGAGLLTTSPLHPRLRSSCAGRSPAQSAGVTLDVGEATALLSARGDDLRELCAVAARVRDAGLEAAGRPGVVTFSPKVFVPVTRLCRDRCHYCTFVATPGQLAGRGEAPYLSPDEVVAIAAQGAALGCKEALFTLGDRPEDRWPEARAWLDEQGYDSTLDYVRALAIQVLEETGLLPHLNPGVMSWEELARLRPVAPSMGMMLETTSTRLFTEKGQPHFGSPDKDPALRLRVLEDAGRLSIPFTTGILVGIGETPEERVDSLFALRRLSRQYGHLQEVIVQNFRAKPDTAMRSVPDLGLEEYVATVAVARLVLGPRSRIQAPPNLVDPEECRLLLDAGIDDWGGVSPLTPDHVNPERPWPSLDVLRELTAERGFTLTERLTAHPEYVRMGEPWIDPRVLPHVRALADEDGLARADARPTGLAWQEPDDGSVSTGRTDLHRSIDTVGRTTDRREDFDSVYGDWGALAEEVAQRTAPASLPGDVKDALRTAEADPRALTDAQALALITADGEALAEVTRLADSLRLEVNGDDVTYVVNRNINFTNVCYTGCRFCAFAQRRTDADAYSLSWQEVADRAEEAWSLGATEVCMQGGIDPELSGTAYFDIVRAVKARVPGMHVHAFSPMEVVNGASRSGMSVEEWLIAAREAGLDSIPGTAAEILDDDVRWILTKGKLPTATWIEVITTAHRLGIPSSSTMMYGHVDNPTHWVAHLRVLSRIQDETGGFTEFVPLPFVHQSSPIYLAGIARPGPSLRDNLAVHAVARILLHGRIDNVQTSWVKLGIDGTRAMLRAGANDLGGTLMEETISRMAGSEHGSAKTVAELEEIAAGISRPLRQRTTTYRVPA